MELNSLQDLFVDELRDLYSAEQQILKALPKMADKASNSQLRSAFQQHEQQTRTHVQRLDRIFGLLNVSSSGESCEAMEGLVSEGKELMGYKADHEVIACKVTRPPTVNCCSARIIAKGTNAFVGNGQTA